MPKTPTDLEMAKDLQDKPWLSGKPYYCNACGLGGPEVQACEDGGCVMESEAEAIARRNKHLSNQ